MRTPSLFRSLALILALALFAGVGCGGDTKDSQSRDSQPTNNSAAADPSGTSPPSINSAAIVAGQGIMVGEVTADSALVQIRLTETDQLKDGDVPGVEGIVQFTIARQDKAGGQDDESKTLTATATADRDYIARVAVRDLQPGTEYVCVTQIGRDRDSLQSGPQATFRTLPGKDTEAEVRFVVVTGMNYAKFHGDDRIDRERHVAQNNTELPPPYSGPDKHLGYPALETIAKLKPHFFVGTGDNVYYDTPTKPRAETLTQMRQKWHEQFVQPRYRQLFAVVPTYWEIDDHDYRYDDCDNSGDLAPSPELTQRVMLEQLPYAASDASDVKTYRTHRVSRDLQIWLTENRWYRSPNAMDDGPEKTIWGKRQTEWLKQTLADSDATFKVLISPTPMVGPDDLRKTDNHTNLGGFRHERDAFFGWLQESGLLEGHFYVVCGDRHWQYHSVDPSGVEEFSCGALVDENARLGRKPGDPKSTDPEGLIRQPYCQEPASGGFLYIRATPSIDNRPAQLAFSFHDEQGKLLYEHVK